MEGRVLWLCEGWGRGGEWALAVVFLFREGDFFIFFYVCLKRDSLMREWLGGNAFMSWGLF